MRRFNLMMYVLLSSLAIGFLSLTGIVVSAEEMGFSVKAIPSEHQRDKKQTYFDLRVKPDTTEELQVEIQNKTDADMTVLVNANTAITNNNGVIDYSQVEPELDQSLVHDFSKMAKIDPEVKLKGKETKIVNIPVDIPKEPFDGIVLGGLHFSKQSDEKPKDEEAGVQVKNEFSYVIGVRLSENDDEITPSLNLIDVKAGQKNYRNTILATIQNDQPHILNKMEVEAFVYNAKDTKEAIYYQKSEGLEMAPNSSFEFGISMYNEPFKSGKYLLKMTVKTKGEIFEFSQEFEVKADEAKKLNEEAVELDRSSENEWLKYLIIVILVLVVIILGLIVYVVIKKKNDKKAKSKNKKNKNKGKSKKKQSSKSRKK